MHAAPASIAISHMEILRGVSRLLETNKRGLSPESSTAPYSCYAVLTSLNSVLRLLFVWQVISLALFWEDPVTKRVDPMFVYVHKISGLFIMLLLLFPSRVGQNGRLGRFPFTVTLFFFALRNFAQFQTPLPACITKIFPIVFIYIYKYSQSPR